ncbi:MAG: hypothetical protein E1N59_1642 [Puniceicoccaceae bacterium 5H]|nr:MAG: hypothetical protein E1N59_1642 [Puniceicoccaceae bacterium 5H]
MKSLTFFVTASLLSAASTPAYGVVTTFTEGSSFDAALDSAWSRYAEDFSGVSDGVTASYTISTTGLSTTITPETGAALFTYSGNSYNGALSNFNSTNGFNFSIDEGFVYAMSFDLFLTDFSGSVVTETSPAAIYVNGVMVDSVAMSDADTFWGFVSDTPVNSIFIDYNGTNFLTVDNVDTAFSTVPEPATYAGLAGMAALGLLWTRRRRTA